MATCFFLLPLFILLYLSRFRKACAAQISWKALEERGEGMLRNGCVAQRWNPAVGSVLPERVIITCSARALALHKVCIMPLLQKILHILQRRYAVTPTPEGIILPSVPLGQRPAKRRRKSIHLDLIEKKLGIVEVCY